MPIQFNCPKCSKRLSVPDSFAGKKARCPGCSDALDVPAVSSPEAVASALDDRPIIGDHPPIGEMLAALMTRITPQMGRICFVVGFLLMVSGLFIWFVLGIIGLVAVASGLSVLILKGENNEKLVALVMAGLVIIILIFVLKAQIVAASW